VHPDRKRVGYRDCDLCRPKHIYSDSEQERTRRRQQQPGRNQLRLDLFGKLCERLSLDPDAVPGAAPPSWVGAVAGAVVTGTCAVTLNANASVTASFVRGKNK